MTVTQEWLKEMFEYRDGNLYKKSDPETKFGSDKGDGYLICCINAKMYRIHRLIYLLHYGNLPKIVDHIDCDTTNNKIENLRAANSASNQWNRKICARNTSGVKNVSWNKRMKKWSVELDVNRKRKKFGYYEDIELAELVAIMAREKYHGIFANHN